MSFLDGLIGQLPAYQPVAIGPTNDNYGNVVDTNTAYANRPASSFQGDINQSVKEQSNLLGPQSSPDSTDQAMNARANQIYNSQINNLMKQSQNTAVARQNQLQGLSIDQQAALYTNLQSRANINWQQLAYKREAAIVQETNRRAIYASLFGGVGALLGAGAAGLYNARNQSQSEDTMQQLQQALQTLQQQQAQYRQPMVTMPGPAGSNMSDYQNLT